MWTSDGCDTGDDAPELFFGGFVLSDETIQRALSANPGLTLSTMLVWGSTALEWDT